MGSEKRIIQAIGRPVARLERFRPAWRSAGRPARLGPPAAADPRGFPDTGDVRLSRPLPRRFYARDARAVARDLIGCRLVHRFADGTRLVARLVEVEAYLGDGSDPASHAHRGPTPRNRSMFGPPGRLYAYRSYGLHTCVNVVCAPAGEAAAVLLRAAEPIEGLTRMRALRALADDARPALLTSGPGRLGQAMGLTLEHDGATLLRAPLTLHGRDPDRPAPPVEQGPRVGISRATDLPYRYFEAESPWVSVFRSGTRRRRSA